MSHDWLSSKHFLSGWRWVIWIILSTIHCPAVHVAKHEYLRMTRTNQALKSGWQRPPLLPQITPGQHASSQFRVQLTPLAALSTRRPQTPWHQLQSKPLSQFQNRHCPLLRFRPRLLSIFTGALLPNLDKTAERETLIMHVSRLHTTVIHNERYPFANFALE